MKLCLNIWMNQSGINICICGTRFEKAKINTFSIWNLISNFSFQPRKYPTYTYFLAAHKFKIKLFYRLLWFFPNVCILHLNALYVYRSQNFCDGPNFLSQPKNLTVFSASSKTCACTKNNFTECKSSFCLAQHVCDCCNM